MQIKWLGFWQSSNIDAWPFFSSFFHYSFKDIAETQTKPQFGKENCQTLTIRTDPEHGTKFTALSCFNSQSPNKIHRTTKLGTLFGHFSAQTKIVKAEMGLTANRNFSQLRTKEMHHRSNNSYEIHQGV